MDLTVILPQIGIIVGLILVGYILGRWARPKVYHGHITEVPARPVKKEVLEKPQSKVSKAFSHSRKPLREVKGNG